VTYPVLEPLCTVYITFLSLIKITLHSSHGCTYEPSKLGRAVHVVYSTAALCVGLRNEYSRQKSVQKWATNKFMPPSTAIGGPEYTIGGPEYASRFFFSLSCSFHRFCVIQLESFWQ